MKEQKKSFDENASRARTKTHYLLTETWKRPSEGGTCLLRKATTASVGVYGLTDLSG